tara:strand:+ start:497 stop:745 length:249 start_codon:yes stop_codon:yes gene_type:complete
MNEEKNLSFTIIENDISRNVFEMQIIVDDNRKLNKREVVTHNINQRLQEIKYEDQLCLIKCFCGFLFLIIFIIIVESMKNNK